MFFMERGEPENLEKKTWSKDQNQPQTLNPCLVPSLRTAPGYTGR